MVNTTPVPGMSTTINEVTRNSAVIVSMTSPFLWCEAQPNQLNRRRRRRGVPESVSRHPSWSSSCFRSAHHPSNPRPIPTPPRKVQNHAKPLASAACVGSVMSPSELKPVMATPRHIAAKIAATTIVAWIENFTYVSACSVDAMRGRTECASSATIAQEPCRRQADRAQGPATRKRRRRGVRVEGVLRPQCASFQWR